MPIPYGRTTRSDLASVSSYGFDQSLDFIRKTLAWPITLTVITSAACPKKGSSRWLHSWPRMVDYL